MEPTQNPPHEIDTAPNPAGNGSGIDLRVTVRDKDGRIVNEQCKEGDLFLYNWVVALMNLIKYGFMGTANNHGYYGIDQSGLQFSTIGYGYPSVSSGRNWGGGGRIVLGSGTQAATIRDYCIAIPVATIIPGAPSVSSLGNVLKITITGVATFAADTLISEAGISLAHIHWGNSGNGYSLVTRDTISPVTAPAGGSLTIQFELWFNGMPPTT